MIHLWAFERNALLLADNTWKIKCVSLGILPFNKSHSCAETLNLVEETLNQYGLSKGDLDSVTMNTISSSFNTVDSQFVLLSKFRALLMHLS